ncbi:TonB-dependent receptor domain-containing protein [Thioalkalivibrio sp. XN279]|uniref:TonB-dependent receptor domain-containing protein n=1 Tax=Thioalkalivibrio sp. XN279 TaxID=2714953 RepID=UPI00140D5166|nr:TonB-dependent receptor [Thioalkalivibrio sp. XN279]NHA13618.1 TonB-dependent receptor [Thioalkalivibrio sp. XN279]
MFYSWHRARFLAVALGAAWTGSASLAGLETDATPLALAPVTVVSTRTARPLDSVVGMVSVLDHRDIDERMAVDPEGLWRYSPGIEVESQGTRFGSRSLNIRGIGGNRVLMEIDGVPVQDRFAVGTFADAGRAGTVLDFVRHIEVLRGPASALYGSKAIGGVVAVSTFDPRDLAGGPGQPGGRLKSGFSGVDSGWHASGVGAWEGDAHGLLLGASRLRAEAPDRSALDQDLDRARREQDALLAKVVLGGVHDWHLRLTLGSQREDARTELGSLLGTGRFATTTELRGDDEMRRHSGALDWQLERDRLSAQATLFRSAHDTRQDTLDLRELLPQPLRIEREFSYDTVATGLRAHVTREIPGAHWRHRVTVGVEQARHELDQQRDARQIDLATGEVSSVVLGESFPLRDIPVTTSDETGVFLQDEIDAVSGRWTVIPALRFDRSQVRARDDAGWRAANPTTAPADLDASDVSPRLGVLWHAAGGVQLWAQWSTGFRAPPAEDLNIGLDIPLFRVRALPNPELKSETSRAWELGLRWREADSRLAVALFHTDYRDFIASMVPLGPDPESGVLLFQSQNIERARIRGVEMEGQARLALLPPRLGGLKAGFAAWWAQGESRVDGSRLQSVGPPAAVAHLAWNAPSRRHELRLSGLFARGQSLAGTADAPAFRAPGYGVFDLAYAWQVTGRLTLRAGVFNLFDRTWWRWGALRDLPADDPLVPALSAPGRSVSLAVRLALGAG